MSFTTHAAERAAERYGLNPTAADWSRAVLDIIDSCAGDTRAATRLAAMPHGVERSLVRLGDCPVIAIYAPENALIITLTPANGGANISLDRGRRGQSMARERGRTRRERAVDEDWGC